MEGNEAEQELQSSDQIQPIGTGCLLRHCLYSGEVASTARLQVPLDEVN